MEKKIKKIIPFLLLIALAISVSSCNRGLGCPNNFKVGTVVDQVVKVLPAVIKE